MSSSSAKYDFSAQRLFIEAKLLAGMKYQCNLSQANYLLNVLRMRSEEKIYVFNGSDGEWLAQIETVKKKACNLNIVQKVREQEYGPDIEYIFAPLKRARLDYMVQKATELGVSTLRPVITHRTMIDRLNLDRMKANVIEAAEQCGILHIPNITEPIKLDKLLQDWDESRHLIFCDEAAPILSPIEALQKMTAKSIAVLIGPEGGFDETERKKLLDLPFVNTISLGPRIMRADTAAVAALTLANAVLGDWKD